jgi:hypothetical protein
MITQTDFNSFIDNNPTLTTQGIGVANGRHNIAQEHADLKNYYDAFLVSCDMLQEQYKRTGKIKYDRNSHSYELKHRAERRAWESGRSVYVPEGALVAAGLYLKLPYEQSQKTTSVTFGVKEIK